MKERAFENHKYVTHEGVLVALKREGNYFARSAVPLEIKMQVKGNRMFSDGRVFPNNGQSFGNQITTQLGLLGVSGKTCFGLTMCGLKVGDKVRIKALRNDTIRIEKCKS